MPALDRGITLNREAQTVYSHNSSSGYRFTVTASDGLNIDEEIFRFTRHTADFITNAADDVFDGICSAEQMASLPIGGPDPDDPGQYFRLDNIDLLFMTRDAADDAWTAIQSDVSRLITSMKQNDVLGASESIRIGDA